MATISPQFCQQEGDHQEEKEANTLDFRAPPPSPIGSSRRASSVTNDEVLTEFLEHSLRVPDLVLPDRIFPRQNSFREIPVVDFQALNSKETDPVSKIRESLSETGCFQVVNHGISPELIGSVSRRAGRIFRVSPEKKRMAVRSPEFGFGFEEVSGDQEQGGCEMSEEEFVWGRSCSLRFKMEGILPNNKYSKFSEKMESLTSAIEKVAKDIIMLIMHEISSPMINEQNDDQGSYCVCHIYKHPHGVPADRCISSLRYDVIRMMIRGSDYSHALSLHICDDASEFHVYSKKGWVSFTPSQNALLVTSGDQLQAWSGGRYKHVIGKPIYTSKKEDCISMAFLYSPPTSSMRTGIQQGKKQYIISLQQQVLFAIFFTIACQFLLHIYKLSCP